MMTGPPPFMAGFRSEPLVFNAGLFTRRATSLPFTQVCNEQV